jgi:L-seryl-tRNA(Ser) seleniumtransferase
MKLGKEEAMGMLAAVEMWVKRDHDAEWKEWMSWMDNIAKSVSTIDGVTTAVREPRGLSNRTPSLAIRWDTGKIGISGEEVSNILFTTEPRIALGGGGGGQNTRARSATETGVSISAWMMSPGEDRLVANRLREVISAAAGKKLPMDTTPPASDISGEWEVRIEFAASATTHQFFLKQDSGRIEGTHTGEYIARDMFGSLTGNTVKLTSDTTEAHGERLVYTFSGVLTGQTMSGDLDMGEYLSAKWTASRHAFKRTGNA